MQKIFNLKLSQKNHLYFCKINKIKATWLTAVQILRWQKYTYGKILIKKSVFKTLFGKKFNRSSEKKSPSDEVPSKETAFLHQREVAVMKE